MTKAEVLREVYLWATGLDAADTDGVTPAEVFTCFRSAVSKIDKTYVCNQCGIRLHVSEDPCPLCRCREEGDELKKVLREIVNTDEGVRVESPPAVKARAALEKTEVRSNFIPKSGAMNSLGTIAKNKENQTL